MLQTDITEHLMQGLKNIDPVFVNEFYDRCNRIKEKSERLSPQRQKAVDFVKQKSARNKFKNDFLK